MMCCDEVRTGVLACSARPLPRPRFWGEGGEREQRESRAYVDEGRVRNLAVNLRGRHLCSVVDGHLVSRLWVTEVVIGRQVVARSAGVWCGREGKQGLSSREMACRVMEGRRRGGETGF